MVEKNVDQEDLALSGDRDVVLCLLQMRRDLHVTKDSIAANIPSPKMNR